MWRTIFLNSIYQVVVLTLVLFKGHTFFDVPYGVGLSNLEWNYENGQHMDPLLQCVRFPYHL